MMGKYGQHRNIILWRYIFCRMKIVAVIKAKMAKMFLSRGKWPIFEEQIIPIWNIWSLMVEIMVSWSDWCSQSNSPALSFTSLQHQEKCGKKLIGILDQITPDMCTFLPIHKDRTKREKKNRFYHFVFVGRWSLQVACNPKSSESWRQIVPIYYKLPQ